ncbi:MAG: metallophosphoesterase [Phycisphaerae bacterium]
MRACFTSDLHGNEHLYEQLDKLVADRRPDLLILGGDLCPDADDDDPVGTQVAYFEEILHPRMLRWLERSSALRVALIAGNHEWLCTAHAMQDSASNPRILFPTLDMIDCDAFAIAGYSNTPPTPYHVKDFERLDSADDHANGEEAYFWDDEERVVMRIAAKDYFAARPTIAEDLAGLRPPRKPWLFVCHAPPLNSALDRLPHVPHPVGSRSVRACIEATRPAVTLHGHIHESPQVTGRFLDQVRQTLCINPGQNDVELHAVLFDVERPGQRLRHTVFG